MKVRDLIRLIEKDGWFQARQKGSHRQYKHSVKKGLVTVPVHRMNDEVPTGTMKNILKQAQIEL